MPEAPKVVSWMSFRQYRGPLWQPLGISGRPGYLSGQLVGLFLGVVDGRFYRTAPKYTRRLHRLCIWPVRMGCRPRLTFYVLKYTNQKGTDDQKDLQQTPQNKPKGDVTESKTTNHPKTNRKGTLQKAKQQTTQKKGPLGARANQYCSPLAGPS